MILGKATIIPLSNAFTLVFLALHFHFLVRDLSSQTPGWKPKNNDGIATKEQQPLLQKPEGKTKKKENKKENKAMNGRGKKTWHEKMAKQEKILPWMSANKAWSMLTNLR